MVSMVWQILHCNNTWMWQGCGTCACCRSQTAVRLQILSSSLYSEHFNINTLKHPLDVFSMIRMHTLLAMSALWHIGAASAGQPHSLTVCGSYLCTWDVGVFFFNYIDSRPFYFGCFRCFYSHPYPYTVYHYSIITTTIPPFLSLHILVAYIPVHPFPYFYMCMCFSFYFCGLFAFLFAMAFLLGAECKFCTTINAEREVAP